MTRIWAWSYRVFSRWRFSKWNRILETGVFFLQFNEGTVSHFTSIWISQRPKRWFKSYSSCKPSCSTQRRGLLRGKTGWKEPVPCVPGTRHWRLQQFKLRGALCGHPKAGDTHFFSSIQSVCPCPWSLKTCISNVSKQHVLYIIVYDVINPVEEFFWFGLRCTPTLFNFILWLRSSLIISILSCHYQFACYFFNQPLILASLLSLSGLPTIDPRVWVWLRHHHHEWRPMRCWWLPWPPVCLQDCNLLQ